MSETGQKTYKHGDEIEVGDIIVFFGTPHRVDRIEPYDHPTVPGAVGIAYDHTGWAISMWPTSRLEVA